jgi:spartin
MPTSHAISMTTSLLVTTITTASSFYGAHSTPSPHHPSSGPSTRAGPPPPPPRALVFLTSERTQKGLASVHAVSGEAVKVSSKTINHIDSMIRRAMGARPRRRERQDLSSTPASIGYLSPGGSPPPLPPRTPSPSGSTSRFALPSYDSVVNGTKPPLPTRPSLPASSSPLPLPTLAPHAPPSLKLTTKDRVLLSLDLILSTIDDSARRVLDTGTQEIGKVVGHTYGPEAAHSSLLMAGTARNVALVYVDWKGVGRRALLRRAGRTFVKAQMSSVGGQGQVRPALPPR